MMFDDLKKELAAGKKQFTNLTLTINCLADVCELQKLLQDRSLDVANLELSLHKPGEYIHTLLSLLDNIVGLKSLKLSQPLPNYVLGDLLASKFARNLLKLSFVHEEIRQDQDYLIQIKMLESTLIKYLTTNHYLKSLTVEDKGAQLTSANFPKLKTTLCLHQNLSHFDQGLGTNTGKPRSELLDKDPEVLSNLNKKNKPGNEGELRKSFMNDYNNTVNSIMGFLDQPKHDFQTWEDLKKSLQSDLLRIDKLTVRAHELSKKLPDLDQYKERLKILAAYVYLIKNAVLIIELSQKNLNLSVRSKIDRFWDSTRVTLLNDMKANSQPRDILSKIYAASANLQTMLLNVKPDLFPTPYYWSVFGNEFPLIKAKALLNDYTKGNSAISRFFHGHWNRHHVVEVNDIVRRIGASGFDSIRTVDDLFAALNAIELVNPKGSLARRIEFLRFQFNTPVEAEVAPRSNHRL